MSGVLEVPPVLSDTGIRNMWESLGLSGILRKGT